MSKQPEYELKEKFYIFDNFITSNKHILESGDEDWDSSKMFFQLSIEHSDNSPLTYGAEKYEGDKKVDWNCIQNINRDKKLFLNAQKNRLALQSIGINQCKLYDDEHLLIYDSEYSDCSFLVVKIEDLSIQNEIGFENDAEISSFEILDRTIVFLDDGGTLGVIDADSDKSILKVEDVLKFYVLDDTHKILIQNSKFDLEVYDIQTMKKEKSFNGHFDEIQNIIEYDNYLISWTAQSPEDEENFFMSGDEEENDEEEFNEDEIDYTDGKDVSVRIWDKKTQKELKLFDEFEDFISGVKKIGNNLVIFTSYELYKVNLEKLKISLVDEFDLICNVEVIDDKVFLVDEESINIYNEKIKHINDIELEEAPATDTLMKKVNGNLFIALENGKNCIVDLDLFKIKTIFGETKATCEEIVELRNGDLAIKDINDTLIVYDKESYKAKMADSRQTHFEYIETKYGVVLYGMFLGVVLLDNKKENFSTFDTQKVLSAICDTFKKQNKIIYTSLDGELIIYDMESHKNIYHERIFNDMFYTKEIDDATLLMWVQGENELHIFSLESFDFIDSREVYSEGDSIEDIIITDGHVISIPSATNDKLNAVIYDKNLKKIKKLKLDSDYGEIEQTVYLNDKLYLGYEYGLVEIWDMKKFKLEKSKEIGVFSDLKVFNELIYLVDEEDNIYIFNQKLKEVSFIEFSKYCKYESEDVEIEMFLNYIVISNEEITIILDSKNEVVKELKDYSFDKSLENMLVLKSGDNCLVLDTNLEDKYYLNLHDDFKKQPQLLYSLGMVKKIADKYILISDKSSINYLVTNTDEKYFYDGFISLLFEHKNELLFELNGQMKRLVYKEK